MNYVVLVEDDPKIKANLVFLLRSEGYRVEAFEAAEPAWEFLINARAQPAVLLLDVRLGEMSGVALVERLQREAFLPPTIVISGEASITETVEALRLGVYDFIEKPFSRERLLRSVANCLAHFQLRNRIHHLETRLSGSRPLLGDSPKMRTLKRTIAKVAPTNGRILIRGESGTGKELVANAIHRQSDRAQKPFIKINCAAIPANLIEDELFGHVRGAFTDARSDKAGLFEEANGGTLFLDEIGDMDLALQTRLLRVLEDGRIRRMGATREVSVDVRVIAATHRDLERAVEEGAFREDLFFRLSAIPLDVPPLKERKGDIPLLSEHFVYLCCKENHMRPKTLDGALLAFLEELDWPGNVRQLKNLCEHLVILGGDPLTADHLPAGLKKKDRPSSLADSTGLPMQEGLTLKEFRACCEREYIAKVLRECGFNYSDAAKRLGLQRTYLYQKVQLLGLE